MAVKEYDNHGHEIMHQKIFNALSPEERNKIKVHETDETNYVTIIKKEPEEPAL